MRLKGWERVAVALAVVGFLVCLSALLLSANQLPAYPHVPHRSGGIRVTSAAANDTPASRGRMEDSDEGTEAARGATQAREWLSERTHAFYYPWYASEEVNGEWFHWNHPVLSDEVDKVYQPPDDIGANFYPFLGPYSSSHPNVIRRHVQDASRAGIGVLVTSWYPAAAADQANERWAGYQDSITLPLLDACAEVGIRVAFHIEPYKGRDPASVRNDVHYIVDKYGKHPAFWPFYYIYDSYLVGANEWARLLSPGGDLSIRNTAYDGTFVALIVDQSHLQFVVDGHFDAGYSYFASKVFVWSSNPRNWMAMKRWAAASNKLWIPCVGPGYEDTRIRPWNARNSQHRANGAYYSNYWKYVLKLNPPVVGITSWNEHHEGADGYKYLDFEAEGGPMAYVDLTRKWVDQWLQQG